LFRSKKTEINLIHVLAQGASLCVPFELKGQRVEANKNIAKGFEQLWQ
jgi:hypothetical protein